LGNRLEIVIFFHQVVPPRIWRILDIVFTLDISTSASIHLALIFTTQINQIRILITDNVKAFVGTRIFDQNVALSIAKFRTKNRPIYESLIIALWVIFTGYFEFCVWFFNGKISLTIISFLYWFLVFLIGFLHMLIGLFGSPIYIIFTSNYIQILQKRFIGTIKNNKNSEDLLEQLKIIKIQINQKRKELICQNSCKLTPN